eukprot:8772227-Pyramimonas_sp.AAC.1
MISSANAQRHITGTGRAHAKARSTGSSARANTDPDAGHPCIIPDKMRNPEKRPPASTIVTRIPEYRNRRALKMAPRIPISSITHQIQS